MVRSAIGLGVVMLIASASHTARAVADAALSIRDRGLGALIVLEGTSLLDEQVSGGKAERRAVSSQALLQCLEQGEALGAVVVRGAYIARSDALLPLEVSRCPGPEFGSRHTAACTLASRTDALIIVVSEERRNVAAVQGDTMRTMPDAPGLEAIVKAHVRAHRWRGIARAWGALWSTGRRS